MQRSSLSGLCLSFLLVTSGCDITTTGPVRTDLHASDNDRLHPGGRVSFRVLERDEPLGPGLLELAASTSPGLAEATKSDSTASGTTTADAAGEATGEASRASDDPAAPARRRRVARPILAVELDYRAATGHEDQESLTGAYYIEYDGRRIDGPTTLDQEFTLHLATADVRGGVRLFERLSIEGMVGISASALNFVVRTPSVRAGETSVGLGANGGARITFTPHPVVDLYAQGQMHLLDGLQDGHETIFIPALEVGSNLHLTRNLSIFGGWRLWQYDERLDEESDITDIDVGGPTFGAALRF